MQVWFGDLIFGTFCLISRDLVHIFQNRFLRWNHGFKPVVLNTTRPNASACCWSFSSLVFCSTGQCITPDSINPRSFLTGWYQSYHVCVIKTGMKQRSLLPPKQEAERNQRLKKLKIWNQNHSRGTMQCRRSCQNSHTIHVYVVPTAVCAHVLYTLIVTV